MSNAEYQPRLRRRRGPRDGGAHCQGRPGPRAGRRRRLPVTEVAAEVANTSGRKAVAVKTDITQEANLTPIDAALRQVGGQLKFLGLVAAVLQKVGQIETHKLAEWDRVNNININANVMLIKHFAPVMKTAGGGSIVTVSSWFGRSGHGFFSTYCASKAALISPTTRGR